MRPILFASLIWVVVGCASSESSNAPHDDVPSASATGTGTGGGSSASTAATGVGGAVAASTSGTGGAASTTSSSGTGGATTSSASSSSTQGGGPYTITPGDPCASNGSTIYTGDNVCTMISGAFTRQYTLHIPPNYDPNKGFVIFFHGAGGTMTDSSALFNQAAKLYGFAVAYPQGLVITGGSGKTSWFDANILRCGTPFVWTNPPDDIAFVRQLVDSLKGTIRFDPKRIYAIGHSAGAHFVHTLGVTNADQFAAIVPQGETLYSWHSWPTPSCPLPTPNGTVSVLVLHGDVDPYTKYCGQNTLQSDGTYLGTSNVDASFDYWSSSNGCSKVNTTATLCTAEAGSPTSLNYKYGSQCNGSAEVKLYRLIGGDHFFPAYSQPLDQPTDVPYNPNFNSTTGIIITDIIWKFLDAHPKP